MQLVVSTLLSDLTHAFTAKTRITTGSSASAIPALRRMFPPNTHRIGSRLHIINDDAAHYGMLDVPHCWTGACDGASSAAHGGAAGVSRPARRFRQGGATRDGGRPSDGAKGHAGGTKRHGRGRPSWDIRAASATHSLTQAWLSEPRRAELLQVNGSRRVLLPLHLGLRRNVLALADEGEAGHDGCDGHETDTQGANKRLPREESWGDRGASGEEAPPARKASCVPGACTIM